MKVNQEILVPNHSNQVLSLHLQVMRSKEVIASDMGGEKVILSIENGKYYNLGEIGGQIWDLVEDDVSVGNVVNRLLDEYEIDRMTCEENVFSFLLTLSDENLITFRM